MTRIIYVVYTRKYLTIRHCVSVNDHIISIPVSKAEKCKAIADLEAIARYFNGTWKETKDDTGYCILLDSSGNATVHKTVLHRGGITHFKNERDAKEAINILGDRVKYLFD